MSEDSAFSMLWSQITECAGEAVESLQRNGSLESQSVSGKGARCVRFELEVFCSFLLSHAMLHSGHDDVSWAEAIAECVTNLDFEYGDLAEGETLESVAESRFGSYGDVSQRAISGGTAASQPAGWSRLLKVFVTAANSGCLTQRPPIVLADLRKDVGRQAAVNEVVASLIVPKLYTRWQRLFVQQKSLRGVSAARLSSVMKEGDRGGFLRRMIAKLGG
jgi:hypothetical protein